MNILLVDDQSIMRAGIRALLRGTEFKIVAEAESMESALAILRGADIAIDLVVMEWNLPGAGGFDATQRLIRYRQSVKTILLTSMTEEPFPERFISAGAAAFISKFAGVNELLDGLYAVKSGHSFVSSDVAKRLASNVIPHRSRSPFDDLSNRELQVMLMAVEGMKVQDISSRLCLSPKTVSTYRYRMFDKLGVKGEAELTRLAIRYGIIANDAPLSMGRCVGA